MMPDSSLAKIRDLANSNYSKSELSNDWVIARDLERIMTNL
jgi:hypothetical protein